MSIRLGMQRVAEGTILFAALTVAGMLLYRGSGDPPAQDAPSVEIPDTTPLFQARREVVVTFIGDVDCGACASRGLRVALSALLDGFQSYVEGEGNFFHSVGVAVTPDIDRGYRYLEAISDWDEISLGAGVLNTQLGSLVWDIGSEAQVPQVVVYSQTVQNHSGKLIRSKVTRPRVFRGVESIGEIAARRRWDLLLRE